jgi:hypothetical protein
MTKFALLGAAAVVLSSTLAGPAMAQAVINEPAKCANFYPNANCQNLGPGNPYTGNGYQRPMTYRNAAARDRNNNWDNNNWNNGWHDSWNDNRWDRRHDRGFWPADAAAGVAGAAIGTAGAIATAPFRDDSYAYYNGDGSYNGYRGSDNRSYAERNGLVCQPGTWFKGDDGRRHPCQ